MKQNGNFGDLLCFPLVQQNKWKQIFSYSENGAPFGLAEFIGWIFSEKKSTESLSAKTSFGDSIH